MQYKAAARATELGYIVCWPSVDCRYDLVLDDGKQLIRVQVKSSSRRSSHSTGSYSINLTYETRHRRRVCAYRENEVDALVVYFPEIDKLCWFPTEIFVGKLQLTIRIDNPMNSQLKGIVFARDYYW